MERLLIICYLFLFKAGEMKQMPLQQAMIDAVTQGNLTFVKASLKKGIDANIKDKDHTSLLLLATHNNDLEMAKLLVMHGADVNQQNNRKDSPFLYAGASGYIELVKLYLQHGARFDIFNRYNGSALIPACERAHLPVVKLLASTKGFPVNHINNLGWTALLEAVILGDGSDKYAKVVEILLQAGCDANILDKNGLTALQHAKLRGYTKIVSILENTIYL